MYKQQQHNKKHCIHGFTLFELMITVAIVGLLAAIGIPSFNYSLRSNRLTTGANDLISAINLARSEAVKRNQSVSIRRSSTNWEDGWNVFVDLNSDGVLDNNEEVIRTYQTLHSDYTLRGSINYANFIRYVATGEARGEDPTDTTNALALCDNKDGNNAPEANTSRLIIVNSVGRPRMGSDNDNDGIPEKTDGSEISSCTSI